MKTTFFVKLTFLFAIMIGFAVTEIYVRAEGESGDFVDFFTVEPFKEFKLEPNKKVEITISGTTNPIAQNTSITEDCKDVCTVSVQPHQTETKKGAIVTFSLKPDYFNNTEINEIITLKYVEGNKTFEAKLNVTIPARVTNFDQIDKKTITLVEQQELPFQKIEYKIDGVDVTDYDLDTSEFFDIKPDVANPLNKKIIGKKVGKTQLKIYAKNTEKKIILAEIPIEVIPAIKKLKLVNEKEISFTENGSLTIKLVAEDSKDKLIENIKDRVVCEVMTRTDGSANIINSISVNNSELEMKAGALSGIDSKTDQLKCKVANKTTADTPDELKFNVKVILKVGYMTVDNMNGSNGNALLLNGSLTFVINLFEKNGAPASGGIEYDLDDKNDSQWVSLSKQGQKLTVFWINLPKLDQKGKPTSIRPQFVKINVTANLSGGTGQIKDTITVSMASIVKFASLRVKLQPMDERTVTDLYGKPTSNEYHVLMVRLFNDLADSNPNKGQGESILAYSSSIEIAVGLEKQFDRGADTGNLGSFSKSDMQKLERDRNQKLVKDYETNLKKLDDLYSEKLGEFNKIIKEAVNLDIKAQTLELNYLRDPNDSRKRENAEEARNQADLAYQNAYSIGEKLKDIYRLNALSTPKTPIPNLPILDGRWYPASPADLIQASMGEGDILSNLDDEENNSVSLNDGEPNCVGTITYRPFTFEMMVNTVDRRAERSVRSRIFKVLNSLALGGSVFTSIAVPANGSDLTLGLEKFGNTLIPGMEKLFPSMKEQYRQNIVSQTMKPIEEIPFGSDVTRVLFIPKRPIRGLITANKVRISQICPFYFKIKVAVISKSGEVKLGSQQIR
jgi:hypothetical protein